MELKFPFNSISVCLFFSFVFSLCILWEKSKPTKKQKLPPGPWKLPILGSLHHLVGELPHRCLRNLSRKYGPLMHLQLGEISTVVVSSPQLAKAITKTHDHAFANRPKLLALDVVFYKCTDIAFSPYGDYWRQMRRICILELLSMKMVKSFNSIRQDELSRLVSSIKLSMPARSPINLMEKIILFNSSMTCRAAFGRVCRDQKKLIAMVREVLSYAGGFDMADLFPSKKWLPYVIGTKLRLLKLHYELDQIYESIIIEHEENLANGNRGNSDVGGEDIVDVLLRVKNDGELQFPITRDNIKAVINDLFSAGSETTATTATWAMSEMMRRPSVLVKAQAEVRQALKGKETIDNKDLEELPYLKCVIKETLRLHPPIPLLLPRECREETKIDDEYIIPPKTRVIVNAWAIGRDPDSWEDPESFLPERFESECVDVFGNHYELVPFGAGRRMCPGMAFGLANVTHSLAALLYHFDWELPCGVTPENFDMSETMGLKATRKNDLYLIPYSPYP